MANMKNHQASHHEQLMAHLLGILGGMNQAPPLATAANPNAINDLAGHLVSAENSVDSSGSLSSHSTAGPTPSLPGGGFVGGYTNANYAATLPTPAEEEAREDRTTAATLNHDAAIVPAAVPSSAPAGPAAPAAPAQGTDPAAATRTNAAPPHPVAEFLFRLTKMLTDDNSAHIEWRNASIFVHDPPGLEKDILPKYFSHSNYSSFQRQMNYFGFRKIAGKGRMAPCSYVNKAANEDISSLLFIKRKKTGVSSAAAKLMAQRNSIHRSVGVAGVGLGGSGMGADAGVSLMNSALPGSAPLGGGMGADAGVSLISSALSGPVPQANPSLNDPQVNPLLMLNNTSMMGGTLGNHLHETNDPLKSTQNVLTQLQQAHAAALVNSPCPKMNLAGGGGAGAIPPAAQTQALNNAGLGMNATTTLVNSQVPNMYWEGGGGAGAIPPAAQNKALNNVALSMNNTSALVNSQLPNIYWEGGGGAGTIPLSAQNRALHSVGLGMNSSTNTVLPTNDQGKFHANPTNAAEWSNSADVAVAQSFLVQQAMQGLSRNLAPAAGGGNCFPGAPTAGPDPIASLHALISQQMSVFSNPSAGDVASAISALSAAPLGAPPGIGHPANTSIL